MPPGGIVLDDGTRVDERCLLQLNTAVYGLVNAPSAWRRALVRAVEDLGYRRSCYGPCVFILMEPAGPVGHLLVEVDDVASQGTEEHDERVKKLRSRFKFGKW
eukprot:11162707-Lingulodinium_polyedra.AAC.1